MGVNLVSRRPMEVNLATTVRNSSIYRAEINPPTNPNYFCR